MSYVNLATKVKVYANGVDVSDYLIQGTLSDDSAYTNTIVKTTGQITLGTDTSILDFDRSRFPIGSRVRIWVRLDNGKYALHPRGTLYITNSNVDIENKTLNLEVGCSLAFIADKEDEYETAVSGLYDDMLDDASKDRFVTQEKDLGALSSILEVNGEVIYQDQYGNIQKLNAFGSDGLGVRLRASKFTSFDKYSAISIQSISDTAIETSVSAVQIDTSVDVPSAVQVEYNPGEPASPNPPPLKNSIVRRRIETPFLKNTAPPLSGSRVRCYISEAPTNEASGEISSESNPNCGTRRESDGTPSGEDGYSYKAYGSCEVDQKEVPETVTNGKYVSYRGPGNQVDREESWEHSSASTWANTAANNSMNDVINIVNEYIAEANALLSKANQHFDAKDAEPVLLENGDSNPAYNYHSCNAATFKNRAEKYVEQADRLLQDALKFGDDLNRKYSLANLTQTFNRYGRGGELVEQKTINWKNQLSFDGARTHTVEKNQYSIFTNIKKSKILLNTKRLPSREVRNPERDYDLKIANETLKTYQYSALYTTETETYIDYENPSNSTVTTNYSTSGSANAVQPGRIIYQRATSGKITCKQDTEKKDLSVTVPLKQAGIQSTSWFGNSTAYTKKITLPVELAPVLPLYDADAGVCGSLNQSSRISEYEKVLKNYALIVAKKISGDNRGFRISEKLRAELFEYYPFYPISISTESIGRAYRTRAAAANWVFNSEQALCSIDCLLAGEISVPKFSNPSTKVAYIKTETAKTLTTTNLKTKTTTNKVKVKSLPAGGSLTLNGSAVSVDDEINIADISANLLVFTPSGAGTTAIEFNFEELDTAGNTLSSEENIYPPISSVLLTASNYGADAGDFDATTTNGGFPGNAGDFDTGTEVITIDYLEGGNFDTGATVTLPQTPINPSAPVGNNSADPETEYGVNVVDSNDTSIGTETLSVSDGDTTAAFNIIVSFNIVTDIQLNLTTSITENNGWNYGGLEVSIGTAIDFGTIDDPNDYNIDFGSFADPVEPVLVSGVV